MSTPTLPCALLSSFTLDQLPALVNTLMAAEGVSCHWYLSPFNQYPQQILDPHSELYRAQARVVFVAVAIEDILFGLPDTWTALPERLATANARIEDLAGLIRQLAARSPTATIFLHNFLLTCPEPHPLLALKSAGSLVSLTSRANDVLTSLASEVPNLFLVNLRDVFQREAAEPLDARLFYLAKMRLSRNALTALAEYYRRLLLAYIGRRKKCLVLDLDNTLWGGIVGEDGPEGLLLSDDGPGRAFQDFQRVLLELHQTGTVLALCSRNEADLAWSVIQEHPAMVLRPQHFAAIRINWENKTTNLQAIATELNLGLDSMVFLDDSSFEREQVRKTLPEVTVPELPADPSDYPAFAARLPFFDSLAITEEDQRRGQWYAEDRQRQDLRQQAVTLDTFLRQLQLQVTVQRAGLSRLRRVAQLTQRTNQFNLTTRRYSEDQLRALLLNGGWLIYLADVCDRIGDSGSVGAAIVDARPDLCRLDTFVVSCRVLGRGIEAAFLSAILDDLSTSGALEMEAEFIATARNQPAKDFLPKNGFAPVGERWRRSLADAGALCPEWIRLQIVGET